MCRGTEVGNHWSNVSSLFPFSSNRFSNSKVPSTRLPIISVLSLAIQILRNAMEVGGSIDFCDKVLQVEGWLCLNCDATLFKQLYI